MLVPEGKEPTQLLQLFRGKFIIHTFQELKVIIVVYSDQVKSQWYSKE